MKSCIVLLSVVSLGSLGLSCAKQEPKGEVADATASANVPAAKANIAATAALDAKPSVGLPRIGGTVTAVGEHFVEVVVHRSGMAEAVVTDSRGTEINAHVKLRITASTRGGARETMELAFSAPAARFTGHAGAGVELGTGAVDVSLEVGSAKAEGRLELCVALESARFGGNLVSLGSFGSEVRLLPHGMVQAFLFGPSGAAVKAGVELEASVRTLAGASERIALSFDPALGAFTGRAAASAQLVPGPLVLSLKAGGKTFVGGRISASLSAVAEGAAKASVEGAANVPGLDAKLDVSAPKVAAGAAAKAAKAQISAKATVAAPKINIQAPQVEIGVKKTATATAKPGASAKAAAGFSFGTK